MKTRFTAVLLAVFIAFSLTIYASADTWPNFGTVVAGTACNQAISDADGAIAFRGFRGAYRASWTAADGKPAETTFDLA